MIDLAPIEAMLTRVAVAAVERHHELSRARREEPGMLTRRALAQRLGVSTAHVSRLEDEGLPALCVGDAGSKRFDLEEVRAWLRARAPRATTPTKKTAADDVDVAGALASAGMRRSA